jgi:hypothetical protein
MPSIRINNSGAITVTSRPSGFAGKAKENPKNWNPVCREISRPQKLKISA